MPDPRRPWARKALLIAALALSGCGGGDETATIAADPATAEDGGGGRKPQERGEPTKPAAPLLSEAAIRELERFAAAAPGEVGIAVVPLAGGQPIEIGDGPTGRAWSMMKVPLLVALLERVGGEAELSAVERAQAEAALTRSDNEAALALFDRLGELEGGVVPASGAIQEVLRRSGDAETEVNTEPSPEGYSTYGQTIWSAPASALFFRALAGGCLLAPDDTDYVLTLMESVVADQRWGLGEAPAPGGAVIAFKGGWGPEPGGGYLVRQGGIVTEGDSGYALSVVAIPDEAGSDSFPAGQDLVSQAASRVAEEAGAGTQGRVTCEP